MTRHDRDAFEHLKTVDTRYDAFSLDVALTRAGKLGSVLSASPPAGGTGGFPTHP